MREGSVLVVMVRVAHVGGSTVHVEVVESCCGRHVVKTVVVVWVMLGMWWEVWMSHVLVFIPHPLKVSVAWA